MAKRKKQPAENVTVKPKTLRLSADLKSPGLEIQEPIFHADKITTSKGPVQSTEVKEKQYGTSDIQYVRKDQRLLTDYHTKIEECVKGLRHIAKASSYKRSEFSSIVSRTSFALAEIWADLRT
jgi:hypothetical protein